MKSVIELVKTAQGYSIVEDGNEINKITGRSTKEKQFNPAPKKFSQQNFTIYPYTYWQEPDYNQKYIVVPAKSQWFNLNQIHEIEKKALPEWFKTKKAIFGAMKPDKFEKNEELYKKYRNYIIDLARNQYVSPTRARKGLAGDVCAILRIHAFLEKNGLINYVFPKPNAKADGASAHKQPTINLSKRKDCIDKDKGIFDKHFDKDHLELLKKISRKLRPACHLCEGLCGVIWYEYEEELHLKTFEETRRKSVMKKEQEAEENKVEQPRRAHSTTKTIIKKNANSFKYLLRLCASCFCAGSIPVVLSMDDFEKRSILDEQTYQYEEPREKKKVNEQNKLIELLQKNKLSLKKTAQGLKLSENEVYSILMSIPVTKIQKLARIDQEEQETEIQQESNARPNGMKVEAACKSQKNSDSEKESQELAKLFEAEFRNLAGEERKLYEEFVQLWVAKVSAKLTKLNDWEKSTRWFARKLISEQRNSLAEALKSRE